MSKVLVDRELLEQIIRLWVCGFDCGAEIGDLRTALRAQPAEAEGVEVVAWANPADLLEIKKPGRLIARYVIGSRSGAADVPLVRQSDHLTALSAVTAERDRLESMLIRTTTRHFARQWKDRADDKKLDECLSEGIAMLEAERDRLRAVLEGAQYPNIDRLKTLTIEQCRQVGETVMRLTIDAQSERDQLRAEVDRLRNELAGKPLVC